MNKRTILSTISILLLALSINICYADLPVHCLKSQVSGEWKLEISELQTVTPPYKMNCGHESPDNPANSYLALKDTFEPVTEFRADLNHDTKVYTGGVEKGKWTMVYDEGLDITLGDHKFTAFFEYFPDETGTVMSNCGRTVVGWYKNLLSGERACFRGEKLLKNEAEKEKLYTKSLQQIALETPDTTLSFLQMNLKSREAKTLNSFAKSNDGSAFADYESIVEKINQNPDKLWTAKVYPDFQGKTMSELNMFVGRKKYGASRKNPLFVNSLLQTSDTSDLPKEFTWKDYIHPAKNQGGCGSCFAVATIGMLESRLKIKYNRDFHLSTQHVLDCSMENQGCKGGYPYFVNTFISSNELVPENCSPYVGAKVSCTTCDLSKLDETYHVKDYGFVGGSFGKSNERDMMIELMNNGPIVVSIEPTSEFMMYSGGVFKSLEPTEWVKLKLEKPEWEKVDHSVLLYGWGETENGVKFWTIQNSWGPNWGDNGSFKMIRGIDESAVESVGEFANPYIVKKK